MGRGMATAANTLRRSTDSGITSRFQQRQSPATGFQVVRCPGAEMALYGRYGDSQKGKALADLERNQPSDFAGLARATKMSPGT